MSPAEATWAGISMQTNGSDRKAESANAQLGTRMVAKRLVRVVPDVEASAVADVLGWSHRTGPDTKETDFVPARTVPEARGLRRESIRAYGLQVVVALVEGLEQCRLSRKHGEIAPGALVHARGEERPAETSQYVGRTAPFPRGAGASIKATLPYIQPVPRRRRRPPGAWSSQPRRPSYRSHRSPCRCRPWHCSSS